MFKLPLNLNLKTSTLLFLLLVLSTCIVAQKKPNFIIVYVDDMGYGDVGINGNPTIKTPNLDRMAIEGMRFTNYYSASPACTASRYALLTGKYPPRAGFGWVLNPQDTIGIHTREVTIAEVLKDKGYKTGMFGKWHLGSTRKEYLPLANGFDTFVGLPYSNDMIPPKYPSIALLNGYDTIAIDPDQRILTKLYTDEALKFIKENKANPFFVYLPYAMPHTPLHASAAFVGKSKRGLYGDVVEELDFHIGRILTYLNKSKLAENTYVIFTSDNGPWLIQGKDGGSAGLFRDGKGSTWEGGMREPFFLWGHRDIAVGQTKDEVFTALDILPSIAGVLGHRQEVNRMDGIDLHAMWKGSKRGRSVFYYFGLNHQLMAVRQGRWKLHVKTYSQLGIPYFEGKLPLLFDLDVDPSEKYDVSADHHDLVIQLKQLVREKEEEVKQSGSFWTVP